MRSNPSKTAKLTIRPPDPQPTPSDLACITCGPLTLNIAEKTVTKAGRVIHLTPKQAQLLEAFMRNPGKVLSRVLLVQEVWNTEWLDDYRMLHVHIRWLREKIEDDPSRPTLVRTVRGQGYRFMKPEEEL